MQIFKTLGLNGTVAALVIAAVVVAGIALVPTAPAGCGVWAGFGIGFGWGVSVLGPGVLLAVAVSEIRDRIDHARPQKSSTQETQQ